MGGALTCGSSRWKGSLRTMVFGGVVVGFARILVAEGVPLIVAGMVELKGSLCSSAPKSFRARKMEVCSSFTQRTGNSAVAPVVASVV
jgi:hypothetical protein